MWKRVLLIGLALFFILTTVAVVAVEYQQRPQVLVVNDDTNTETQLLHPPQRVVVLEPGMGQLMHSWQRGNLVVACAENLASLFPAAENLGPAAEVNVAQIAATRPDLVIAGAQQESLVKELRAYGFPALLVRLNRLNSLMVWPERLATVLVAEQQAAQTLRLLEKDRTEFLSRAKETLGAGLRVLWVVDEQFTIAGRNTLEDDLLALVGVDNAAAVLNRYPTLSPADILVLNPQVILAPETLFPELEKQFRISGAEPENWPRLVPVAWSPDQVAWHDVFTQAERLLDYLELASEENAEGAVPSAGN
ncbi:MAG: ABC transporter substrate-binding protein [Firmicutes bacterium]|nr:ABC transporter substrate-binding protein [Bacillota bacterium]